MNRTYAGRRYIESYVEVGIDEFDDEALLAEVQDRKLNVNVAVSVEDMYVALKLGKNDQALELLRQYIMDVTGRIL